MNLRVFRSSSSVAATNPDRTRAGMSAAGVSNFGTLLETTESYRRDARRVEYGDERDPKMRELLERIAPVNNAHKITKPLFIIQGKNDPRAPASNAERMAATIRKDVTPVWYLLANDEGHGFAKRGRRGLEQTTLSVGIPLLLCSLCTNLPWTQLVPLRVGRCAL